MSFPVASEDDEQITFVQWLELVGLRFTSVPNSTYTTSWKQKTKNHYTGLRKGFPDLIVIVPPKRSKDGRGHLLTPEMKKVKGGTLSPDQKEWIDALNEIGDVEARECKGAQAAIDFVNEYLRPGPVSLF